MFAGLKNKIKEETGSDPTMLPPLPAQKGALPLTRGRHSRRESGSSVGSASLDGWPDERCASPVSLVRQDSAELRLADGKVITPKEVKKLEKREEEWRKKLQKKDEEWSKKLEKKEEELKKMILEKEESWTKSIEILEKEKSVLEEEKLDVIRQKLSLEESLKTAEEYKKKVFQYQEDIDQLEGFQTQEMAKVKHLLLVKEQEIAEKVNSLKESSAQIETLKSEVNRLRRYEEEFDTLQESLSQEKQSMQSRLQELEKQIEDLEVECTNLGTSLEAEKNLNTTLNEDVTQLRRNLEAEKTNCSNLDIQLQKERNEKDVALMRNAEVSQQGELARQQVREQEQEVADLQRRVSDLERDLSQRDGQLDQLAQRLHDLEGLEHDKQAAAATEYALRQGVSQLEEQLAERNKQIKVLQQRLGDMKKTLQRELRCPSQSLDGSDPEPAPTAVLDPSSSKQLQHKSHQQAVTNNHNQNEDDINFTYLKHVVIKFLTSRECEAQHLTKAVSTLLRFSPEEERLLRDTLEYRMSWFGTRPRLGNGQTTKTIPHS